MRRLAAVAQRHHVSVKYFSLDHDGKEICERKEANSEPQKEVRGQGQDPVHTVTQDTHQATCARVLGL